MENHPLISIVLPAHNESTGLKGAVQSIEAALMPCCDSYEFIIVDDGSTDGTYKVIKQIVTEKPYVRGIRFSRNFGKEAALLAGLKRAAGDAIITLDADLQHPPELIPKLVESWRRGYKVVNAVKENRSADSFIVRLRANIFNFLLTKVGRVDVQNSSDFKLLDRVAVDILIKQLPERRRFFRGLSNWVGYPQTAIPFVVDERSAGEGKWSLLGLFDLAITAIVSFTSAPLRIVTVLGFATFIFGFIVASDAIWSWFHGRSVSGFATIIITVLLLSSFIMISLGIIGEYIAKIYDEIKFRPVYLIESACGFGSEQLPVSDSNDMVVPLSDGDMSERSRFIACCDGSNQDKHPRRDQS